MSIKELEKIKRGLIIVDVVNGFLNEGALADPYIRRIIPANIKLIKNFLNEESTIVAFKDAHTKDSIEFKRYPEHCLENTFESELIDEFKPYLPHIKKFNKNSTCGFMVPWFRDYLECLKNLKELVITGDCTDICVINLAIPLRNYFDQNNLDVRIVVPKDAVETYDAPYHHRDEWNEMAFRFMNQAGIETPETYKKEMR